MHRKPVNHRFCPNPECSLHGQLGKGNVVRHGFIRLKRGRRRRYCCTACGRTFCSTVETPYYRLQCTRKTFDHVALMGATGTSKSDIARIKGISWNTVARFRLTRVIVRSQESPARGFFKFFRNMRYDMLDNRLPIA